MSLGMIRIGRSFAVALLLTASAHAQSVPVTVTNSAARPVPITVTNTPAVTIANTPAVTISGTPTVLVSNQPGPGAFYNEVFSISISYCCGNVGAPGSVVPAGTRRIVTSISATWTCPSGHGAQVSLHSDAGSLILPGQFAYRANGVDTYATLNQLNAPQRPGSAFQPIIESDAACDATIFVLGVEVPTP